MAQVLRAIEMFNELVQKGYIIPVSEHPNLKPLSLYRSVPSIMTGGTATFAIGTSDAELQRPAEGDSRHTG